jgi:hypothetical protein
MKMNGTLKPSETNTMKILEDMGIVVIIQNSLWGRTKEMLRGKFIDMSPCIKKSAVSQISNIMIHFKIIEK